MDYAPDLVRVVIRKGKDEVLNDLNLRDKIFAVIFCGMILCGLLLMTVVWLCVPADVLLNQAWS